MLFSDNKLKPCQLIFEVVCVPGYSRKKFAYFGELLTGLPNA